MNCQIITYIYKFICFSRPVRFDNTTYLNRSGAETRSFNRIMSFEMFQGLLEMSSRSTAIEVLGTPVLKNMKLNEK